MTRQKTVLIVTVLAIVFAVVAAGLVYNYLRKDEQTRHPLLLRGELLAAFLAVGLQARAHERLALVALELLLARLGVAGLHLLLLSGGLVLVLGGRAAGGDQQAGEEGDGTNHGRAPVSR